MLRRDFHYDLPDELIAQEPRARGSSRMMVVTPAEGPPVLNDSSIAELPSLLGREDLLILNDTRVFPARLFAAPKGAMKQPIEILLTRQVGPTRWECWCRPARRVRRGDQLRFSGGLTATVEAKDEEGSLVISFDAEPVELWQQIERIGVTPLPPYIKRAEPEPADREAYQTVYAQKRGAIAAPTAGLHFTNEILQDIVARGVSMAKLTLHVGIGTFKPVKADEVADHVMDSEAYEIPEETANQLNEAIRTKRRVVAVGTTTVRALESALRRGQGTIEAGAGETRLFITPGYAFGVVDALLTNFHLPESTLLMLVSAFGGRRAIRLAYAEAVTRKYRFYSFGDCMFLRQRGDW